MKPARNSAVIAIAIVALAACSSLSPAPPPGQQAAVPAPAARPGTFWSYRAVSTFMKNNVLGQASLELGAADAKRLTGRPGASGTLATLVFTPSWELEQGELPNIGTATFAPAFPVLRFPLEPGKSWRMITVATVGEDTYQVQVSATVDGWERITVPAGEFDAIRVSIIANPQDAKPWRTGTTIYQYWWYAPAVNGIVRRVERSEYIVLGGDQAYIQQGDNSRTDLTAFRAGP